jgi:putative ABC transport system permease protein
MWGTTMVLALREIRRHLMRSFLTTLGIIIGVASVITMVTLGKGATADISEQISALGSNVLIIFPIQDDQGVWHPFEDEDIVAIREQIAGVKAVAGSVSKEVTAIYNGQHWKSNVEGVSNEFMVARSVKIAQGRSFTDAEEARGDNVCILGETVLHELFASVESPLGEEMRLDNVSCRVIGVAESRSVGGGGGGQDADNSVLMPIKNVQRRFIGNDNINNFAVSYDTGVDSAAMQTSIVDLLRERRFLIEGQDNDFDIVDTAEINKTVANSVGTLTAIVSAIAGISLVVGGVGIMNIMLVSVTERTREIGIRMAIGARAHEVRRQFLTEAVVLCCFGGLVGILLAFALSTAVSAMLELPFTFDPFINLLSFGISALIGIVFGYFPARRAAALDPIEALRHE